MALARIKHGVQKKLYLGNLDAKRDWGFAGDYVEAMWLMLQAKKPEDYVIATGKTYSVRQFLTEAFGYAGLDWKKYVAFDKKYLRPTEVEYLLGDSSKARKELKWKPKVDFKGLSNVIKTYNQNDYNKMTESIKLNAVSPGGLHDIISHERIYKKMLDTFYSEANNDKK